MEIRLDAQLNDYLRESEEIIRAFSPYITISDTAERFIKIDTMYNNGVFYVVINDGEHAPEEASITVDDKDILSFKKLTKRLLKSALYVYMCRLSGISLPYGDLTGVRPTKLLYELLSQGQTEDELIKRFFVRPDKAALIRSVVDGQRGIYTHDDHAVDVFLNIPFCPTRCAYCSFISTEYDKVKKRIPQYLAAIEKEIFQAKRMILDNGLKVRAVYVGGGTPTVLSAAELKSALSPFVGLAPEFTVEGGRPDTITPEKLDVLSDLGVTRISVNPQTFKDETLRLVGRRHSVDDSVRVIENVRREYDFVLNADLIAGLPNETVEDFSYSVARTVELWPQNITVHSLAVKRGSKLNEEGAVRGEFGIVDAMLSDGHLKLQAAGYAPYYMYRLKNIADNLENTGYAKPGTACVYNVDIMEDAISIIGIGAGAMSKLVTASGGRIERLSNPKGSNEYLERVDDILSKKEAFFTWKTKKNS